ncbi:MAG: DUF2974 domain-containing protein [Anaerolineaceae bacterium]|jgi:hypothetical protein
MHNIQDYLDWRGDLTFANDPFNEVDNLVFSVFSYLDFEGVVPNENETGFIFLAEAATHLAKKLDTQTATVTRSFFSQIPLLFEKAAKSNRYGGIRLSHYINQIELEQVEQFSAVVFSITDRQHFVAFSGTDDTLAGWKEDLEMSFLDEVPAQKSAATYLEKIMADLPGEYYLGGHSKGGNLAVYAASFAGENRQDRILGIYNNDGPGFQSKTIQSKGYQNIIAKITTYLPKSSVVGMLLEHFGEYKVVHSDEAGVMQHNAFSWEVQGNHFVYAEGLSKSSLTINTTIRAWLNQISMEERAEFVHALFDVLQATGAETVSDLSQEKLASAKTMIQTYRNLEPTTQSNLRKVIEIFFSESQRVMWEEISSMITKKLPRKKADRSENPSITS